MTPYEAERAGMDAGASHIRIETDNGTLKVYHGDDDLLLLDVSGVRAGTWDRLWDLLETCGTVEFQTKED